MKAIKAYADGGARGNPGPAAIGGIIFDEKGNEITSFSETIGIATNNVAEYKAVIKILSLLIAYKEKIKDDATINLYLDSELVVSQINGLFKVKNQVLRNLLFSVREKEAELQRKVIYFHIPREQNKAADKLVNSALDKSSSPPYN